MADLIDRTELENPMNWGILSERQYRNVLNVIRTTPSVDAVPVTRCRDCRRHKYGRFCDRTGVKACPDDFCSYAEPKEEDDGKAD